MNALMLVAQTLIDPGDNLVIVAPVWPNIAAAVTIMGGEPRLVSLDPRPDGGWRLDLERLFAACDGRTRGIFVNSPSNPTGWVISADEIGELLAFARRRGLWLIADEVYARIVYGNRAAPSFSRTGWTRGPTDRGQQLFQELGDDRLAARLDDDTARAAADPRKADRVQHQWRADLSATCCNRRDPRRRAVSSPRWWRAATQHEMRRSRGCAAVAASRWRGRTALSMRFFGWTA